MQKKKPTKEQIINFNKNQLKLPFMKDDRLRCNDCKSFKRSIWSKSQGGGDQTGGYCKLLAKTLIIDNFELYKLDDDGIYVQDTFGCNLGRHI